MINPQFLDLIKKDFPSYVFKDGPKFAFRPPKTIYIGPSEEHDSILLLHELGHAILGHVNFNTDPERLKMECAAWEKARALAIKYGVDFDEDLMQDELDTYRNWLDKKSRCKKCGLTRYQTPDGTYHCPRCENYE